MVKTVVVTLAGDIPDTALSADATVKVADVDYTGKVSAIIVHEDAGSAVPPTSTVTLKGTGLAVET